MDEYKLLFSSSFDNENYSEKIVRILGSVNKGLRKKEILAKTEITALRIDI